MDTKAAAELITRSHRVRGEAEMSFEVTMTAGLKGTESEGTGQGC